MATGHIVAKTGARGHSEPGHVYFLGEEFLASLPLQHKYLCPLFARRCQPCLNAVIKCSSFAGTLCNTCRRCCREWRSIRNSI